MRQILRLFGLFAFVLPLVSMGATSGQSLVMTLPGIGVKIVPPVNTRLGRVGTHLIDDEGEMVVTFMQGEAGSSPNTDPVFMELFKHAPERISTATISGNLYRRTREADGGPWDGWMFTVPHGTKVLTAMAMYTGKSAEAFERMRNSLLTLQWDPKVSDPELALGVKAMPKDFRLVTGITGAVVYNETGKVGADGPSLFLHVLTIPEIKGDSIMSAGCESSVKAGFGDEPFVGPVVSEKQGLRLCEAWSKGGNGEEEMRYTALIRLPSGGIVNAMGTASPEKFSKKLLVFRSAIKNMRVHPGRVAGTSMR